METDRLLIATTTVSSREQADAMARALISSQLAACVQVDGPITSHYVWLGQHEETNEWRLTIKSRQSIAVQLQEKALSIHPYDVPQWVSVLADIVSPGYFEWVKQSIPCDPSP
jgi:periplasmic divalent cation tolerance protein